VSERLDVKKTHKLFIGGAFPRSESERSYPALNAAGEVVARMARASRKDLRDAVRAARTAQEGWAGRSAYNRGQILYRLAEMVEDRRESFVGRLAIGAEGEAGAQREVDAAIDRLVWYAGWCDKLAQTIGNLNPVAGPFFNLSSPEPVGVVGLVCPERPALLGMVSRLAPILVPGNAVVVVASEAWPLAAVTLAEAVATADVPAGVVNILTGEKAELLPFLAGHMDVNALDAFGAAPADAATLEEVAVENVKRFVRPPPSGLDRYDWLRDGAQSPYLIGEYVEIKTVWHPIGS
jgi:acyl-CoA reductase-like NAD-dependent aldehyde dehydrogenase